MWENKNKGKNCFCMSRGIWQVKFCHNYKTSYLQLNIDQLPCKFLIQFLDPELQYSLSRFQRRFCGMRDESKNGCGTQDEKPRITGNTKNLHSNQAGSWWTSWVERDCGIDPKILARCGIQKVILYPPLSFYLFRWTFFRWTALHQTWQRLGLSRREPLA